MKQFEYPAHSYALQIESISRRVFNESDRGGFGGIADANFCERNPLTAIVSSLARIYEDNNKLVIDNFIQELYWDIGKSITEIGEDEIKKIIIDFRKIVND